MNDLHPLRVHGPGIRQALVDRPEDRSGYDALITACYRTDPAAALPAARRSCVIDPGNRRIRKNLLNLLAAEQRWDELRAAVPVRQQTLPARRTHPVDLAAAVSLYERLMAEQSRRAGEAWTPSRVEDVKRRLPLDETHLGHFRRSEVSGGTQNTPDRPRDFPALDFGRLYPDFADAERQEAVAGLRSQYLGYLNRLYQYDAPGIAWYQAAAIDDDRFGGRMVELPGIGLVTAKSIQSAYYACRIAARIPRRGVVLEIGGGFGALAARLLAIRPDISYLVTDLPVNMVLTHTYLTSLYGGAVAGVWDDGARPGAGCRVAVVPPWLLASLPIRVDLAINTMSFQHMDRRNHAFYGAAMRALDTRSLYHVNRDVHRGDPGRDTMVVPASQYGFMADFDVLETRAFSGSWIEVIANRRSAPPAGDPPAGAPSDGALSDGEAAGAGQDPRRKSDAGLRRAIVARPEARAGYDAAVLALQNSAPDTAVTAALRVCMIDPQARRSWRNLLVLLIAARRWSAVCARTPRRPARVPPRRDHPVDLEAGVARYRWLMDQLEQRSAEGWTPSAVEDSKRRFPLDRERLANFRRSEVSSGTQTIPDRPGNFPPLAFDRLYPDLTGADRRRYAPALYSQFAGMLNRLYQRGAPGIDWFDAVVRDDDRFGARLIDVPRIGPVTAKSLQSSYYACRIMSQIPRFGVVLEIGGGFGSLASRLLAIRPDVTYVLTDLPVNMVLTHTYLTSLYGSDAVAGLWEDGDLPTDRHRVLIVPPWRLATLPLRVDLAVNTMSFQHMDERNHAFYGDAMAALGTRRLYHVNRNVPIGDPATDTMVVPAERYGFMAAFESEEVHDFDGKWIEVFARAKD